MHDMSAADTIYDMIMLLFIFFVSFLFVGSANLETVFVFACKVSFFFFGILQNLPMVESAGIFF